MSKYTDKTEITENERLAFIGLVAVAAQSNDLLRQLEHAACEITGEAVGDMGHAFEAICSDAQPGCNAVAIVDQKLRSLGIAVRAISGDA